MDEQTNPLERDLCLSVVLPGGLEKNATVHGSKPVMDLLVTLCASYHLNPSDHTVEFLSPNRNNVAFKPNSPVGSLEAEKIVLRPKGAEEKIRRPYMPEASVRLLINYRTSHKAVVRVSPRVPLGSLLPVVCDKCEFSEATTVLLRDSRSGEALDLTKTLNDLGLREVYAKDTADHQRHPKAQEAAVAPSDVLPPPPRQDSPKGGKKQRNNAGLLSLFRRGKKKPERAGAASTPASPARREHAGAKGRDVPSHAGPPADVPKKRRAPQPPMGASQSVPNDLDHARGAQGSAGSASRSSKRRAPPPPGVSTHRELQADTEVKGAVDSLTTAEEARGSDESDSVNLSPSPSSSPRPPQPWSTSPRRPLADAYLPSFRGRDFSDARCALAKVLTSSVSKGALVKRLRSSATFPKFYDGAACVSVTQRRSDDGVSCAEREPCSKSNPPAEPEWEDPVRRRGMVTYTVIPSKVCKDPEPGADQRDQIVAEHKGAEDPCSLEGSETETPSPGPGSPPQETQTPDGAASLQPPPDLEDPVGPGSPHSGVGDANRGEVASEATSAPQSNGDGGGGGGGGPVNPEDQGALSQSPTNMEHRGSCTDGGASEEEVGPAPEEEEASFPPPPPPIFFDEGVAASSPPPLRPPAPTSAGQSGDSNGDHQRTPASDRPAPKPRDDRRATPSRFAQAVATAVQRSRLQNHGKGPGPRAPGGPQGTLPSPPRSMYQFGA